MKIDRDTLAFAIGALAQNYVAGSTIVALAWTILEVSGTYESVGIVFLVGNLTNLLIGPFVGVLIDRFERRSAFLLGACLSGTALALPILGPPNPAVFYVVALLCSIGGGAQGPALESLLQRITPAENLPQFAAARNLLRQLGLVGGAGISGIAIAASGPQFVFGIAIVISILGGVVVRLGLPPHRPTPKGRQPYFSSLFDGIALLRRRDIFLTGAVIVASWSAGQVVNASLAGFVKQLGFDSAAYGIGDALWSVGAFTTALWLAHRFRQAKPPGISSITGLGGLGLATIALSYASESIGIFISCAILGVFFSIAKVISDSQFIVICENDVLGRVRSNLNALSGGVGVIVYIAPTLFSLPADLMLRIWGIILLCAFAALTLAKRVCSQSS
ncbi:MAG: MFS transporter [Proteobacteria bacterium]|nr:MFS transporter [Pseudomonadota bacterium]